MYLILYCIQSFILFLLFSWVFSFEAHIFVNFALKPNYFFRHLSSTKYLDSFLTYWDLKLAFLALGML